MQTIFLKHNISDDKWEEFVDQERDASIFQSLIWARVLSKANLSPFLCYVMQENNIMCGGVTSLWFAKYPLLSLFSSSHTKYAPVVRSDCNEKVIKEYFKNLDSFLSKRVISHEIVSTKNFDFLTNMNYVKRKFGLLYTFIVDLSGGENSIWKALEKRCRNSVEKAKKLGVKVRERKDEKVLEDYSRIQIDTNKRLGGAIFHKNLVKQIYNLMTKNENARFYFAEIDSVPIASTIILRYREKAYYYMSCSLSKYWAYQPNNILLWEVMKREAADGIKSLDLMGVPAPNDMSGKQHGLYLFKKSFGGKLFETPNYYKFYSRTREILWNSIVKRTIAKLSSIFL